MKLIYNITKHYQDKITEYVLSKIKFRSFYYIFDSFLQGIRSSYIYIALLVTLISYSVSHYTSSFIDDGGTSVNGVIYVKNEIFFMMFASLQSFILGWVLSIISYTGHFYMIMKSGEAELLLSKPIFKRLIPLWIIIGFLLCMMPIFFLNSILLSIYTKKVLISILMSLGIIIVGLLYGSLSIAILHISKSLSGSILLSMSMFFMLSYSSVHHKYFDIKSSLSKLFFELDFSQIFMLLKSLSKFIMTNISYISSSSMFLDFNAKLYIQAIFVCLGCEVFMILIISSLFLKRSSKFSN